MVALEPLSTSSTPTVTVRQVLTDPALGLHFQILAGETSLDRPISHPRIQKSGLPLVGHLHGFVPSRIQVLGETELSYLESLDQEAQRQAAAHLLGAQPSCVVITRGSAVPPPLVEQARLYQTPLIVTQERSSVTITALHTVLDERLAPRQRIHGVLIDIFEVGVLICGKSGIGKSECALELVMRGHRLVADDIVECDYRPPKMVFGEPAPALRHYMEVRGLGILNIKDLYGVTRVRERKRIDLIVLLENWDEHTDYDRLGAEDQFREILGVPLRAVRLPIQPGRNMSAIIEIAAREELLRRAGHHPAKEFLQRLEQAGAPAPPSTASAAPKQPINESALPPRANSAAAEPPPSSSHSKDSS